MLNKVQFEVIGGKFTGIVDLSQKTCTCKVFDLDHLPCTHALAAIQKIKGNITEFVSRYYKFSTWSMSYTETILLVLMKSE